MKHVFEPWVSDHLTLDTATMPPALVVSRVEAYVLGRSMKREPNTANLLRSLEEQLLQPEIRRSAAKVGDLLADEFVEFGSSGRAFSKSETIEVFTTGTRSSFGSTVHCRFRCEMAGS